MRRWDQVILIEPCNMTKILRLQVINDGRSITGQRTEYIVA